MRRKLVALALMLSGSIAMAADEQAVVENYANLAHAVYEDALITAQQLQQATDDSPCDTSFCMAMACSSC